MPPVRRFPPTAVAGEPRFGAAWSFPQNRRRAKRLWPAGVFPKKQQSRTVGPVPRCPNRERENSCGGLSGAAPFLPRPLSAADATKAGRFPALAVGPAAGNRSDPRDSSPGWPEPGEREFLRRSRPKAKAPGAAEPRSSLVGQNLPETKYRRIAPRRGFGPEALAARYGKSSAGKPGSESIGPRCREPPGSPSRSCNDMPPAWLTPAEGKRLVRPWGLKDHPGTDMRRGESSAPGAAFGQGG